METRAEIRMAAAANYYARRWGYPVPEMTPRFAETIIARWRDDAKRGIVAIPAEESRNHKPIITERNHIDFGGSSINMGIGEVAIGREVYRGPDTR